MLHRTLQIQQYESLLKPRVNSTAAEGQVQNVVLALHVAPVMLLFVMTDEKRTGL